MSTTAQSVFGLGAFRYARRVIAMTLKSVIKSPRGIQWMVVFADVAALLISWVLFYAIRNSSLFSQSPDVPMYSEVWQLGAVMALMFWMMLFWFSGVYISVHNRAFFDEYYSVLKIMLIGFVAIFAVVYLTSAKLPPGSVSYRFVSLLIYSVLVASAIGVGRYL